MKKLSLLAAILLSTMMVNAQDQPGYRNLIPVPEEVMRAVIIFTGMYLIGSFILTLIRTLLDHRLKRRMLDKGVSEELARQFFQSGSGDVKALTMKWFIIFLSVAAGFILVSQTQPLGFHSIGIVCFCIALGYLAYYFFVRKTENK
ncbi:MAG: hypothetical protein J7527_11925 [Chitinophagaceae bacterium]|nr:hypothetical protein [Chitinophagaceae bacterium]